MTIKNTLSLQDYINANFALRYNKLSMKIITGIILLFLLISLLGKIFYPDIIGWSNVFVFFAMATVIPLMTWLGAKQNYKANKRVGETIEYHFSENDLSIKGESFNTQFTLDKIYQVTHTKNWILIWSTRQIANPISKKQLWEGDIHELKELLDKHKVKNNL